jgi:nucleoredoxin
LVAHYAKASRTLSNKCANGRMDYAKDKESPFISAQFLKRLIRRLSSRRKVLGSYGDSGPRSLALPGSEGKIITVGSNRGEFMKPIYVVVSFILFCGLGYGESRHPFLEDNAKALTLESGKKAEQDKLTSKKIVLLYFSAHWCPPCRKFTPELVKFYNENGGGDKFEILFVSSDKTAEDMMAYMSGDKMPWLGLRWGSSKTQAIKGKYAGRGIPCLVMIGEDDKVLSHSYEGENYVGPHKVLDDLKKKLSE